MYCHFKHINAAAPHSQLLSDCPTRCIQQTVHEYIRSAYIYTHINSSDPSVCHMAFRYEINRFLPPAYSDLKTQDHYVPGGGGFGRWRTDRQGFYEQTTYFARNKT